MRSITVVTKRTHQAPGSTRVYIGRGSPLGNVFVIGVAGTRDDVIAKYRSWLGAANDESADRARAEIGRLRIVTGDLELECYCAPKACHGDIIKALLEKSRGGTSPEECVAILQARGVRAVLHGGVPLVPSAAVPTQADKYTAIQVVEDLGLSARIGAEGMFIEPGR